MQSRYSSDVAHLLKLPGPRKLALARLSCNDEVVEPLDWPVEASSSAVKTLILHNSNVPADFPVHMVASCHALSQVEIERPQMRTRSQHEPWAETGTTWLAEVMAALQEHRASLKILRLEPSDYDKKEFDRDAPYERLDGFDRLDALESLSTSWNLLIRLGFFHGIYDWKKPHR
jgi:hypothetical protein